MNDRGATPAKAALAITLIVFFALLLFLGLAPPGSRANFVQTMGVVCILFLLASQLRPAAPERTAELAPARYWIPIVIGALAYAPCLRLYFVSDDFVHLALARAPLLEHLGRQFTRGQVTESGYRLFFRPLGFASLALDYRLFHLWPLGYHALNVLLHLCAVAGLFVLCQRLHLPSPVPATAAAVFALLPVNAQAVAYIAARFDLLATALALWSLVFYVAYRNGGRKRCYVVSLALFLLGTWTKENVFVLPALIAALEWLALAPRRCKPVLGYGAVAVASFAYRWHALGGIGGYKTQAGAPAALALGKRTLLGILVRAPAESLMGFDWLQPPAWHMVVLAAGITAVMVSVAILATSTGRARRLVCLGLLWVLVAAAPAHSLLWSRDPGLVWSRVLYFGSAGLALALAVVLATLSAPASRRGCMAALMLLFALSLEHNLAAWSYNSRATRELLAELQRRQPAPSPGARFVIIGMPDQLRGVRFFFNGIGDTVRLAYGRADLDAAVSASPAPVPPPTPVVEVRWTGKPGTWIELAR